MWSSNLAARSLPSPSWEEPEATFRVNVLGTLNLMEAARDAVRALWLLARKGEPGGIYNLCSGTGTKVRGVLEMFLAMASRPIPVEQDAGRFRLVDKPFVVGDNSRLRALGWAPQVALRQSVAAILDYWRSLS